MQQDSLPSFLSTAEMLAVQGLTVNNEEPSTMKNTIYVPSVTTTTSAAGSGFVQSNVLQSVAQPAAAPSQMVTINTRLSAPVVADTKPIATYTVPLPSITSIPELVSGPALKIRHSTPSININGKRNRIASAIVFFFNDCLTGFQTTLR